MILAFDTYYFGNKAKTICLAFEQWTQVDNFQVYAEVLEGIAEYTPGEFYKRELPCILSLLKQIDCRNVQAILVDGYVFLDDEGKLGLGGHLYQALTVKVPVIGVAKTNFATIVDNKTFVFRGESKNPLYITSIGIDKEKAADLVKSMGGEYRIPTLLKHLDMLTKT
ncbi:endonuclease V [Pseudochryseolinea flava]|uniref:Endonuclease V n=1 Tax=Pseudochryseolinea flava TaxID=2059302 RepID=A0A364Y4T7_9BACT|nr:endonuclease V [Pseudochryseolinea flava]RAW01833.1 endonuclease V [Pseudochryseolinea flava]